MKKLFILTVSFMLIGNVCFASNYQSTKSYKFNEYNSRGQKVSYTKVYYNGDRSNVKKVEAYNTKGKRTKQYRR